MTGRINMKISAFYPNVLDALKESGISLSEALAKIKQAGVSALDFDYRSIKDGFSDEVTQSGLAVNSIYAFFDYSESGAYEKAKAVVNLAKEHGAVAMFVPEKFDKETIAPLKEIKDRDGIFTWLDGCDKACRAAETIEKLSVYGEKIGVPCAVENFDSHRSMTERLYEIEWLFSKAPHLEFNLDTGNSITCGEDAAELYAKFREKIVNVHCKDRLKDNRTTAVGTGEMPITEIRNRLIRSGYSGGFSVEVFGVPNMLEAIVRSAENLNG